MSKENKGPSPVLICFAKAKVRETPGSQKNQYRCAASTAAPVAPINPSTDKKSKPVK
jgi:hypothetical protein